MLNRTRNSIAKWVTGAALAAALLVAAPHKAEAQVGFGVQVGSYPAYGYGYAAPYGYNAYGQQRYIEHEQWEAARAAEWRHEQWERARFYGRDHDGWHDHDGWRDHDRRDSR